MCQLGQKKINVMLEIWLLQTSQKYLRSYSTKIVQILKKIPKERVTLKIFTYPVLANNQENNNDI